MQREFQRTFAANSWLPPLCSLVGESVSLHRVSIPNSYILDLRDTAINGTTFGADGIVARHRAHLLQKSCSRQNRNNWTIQRLYGGQYWLRSEPRNYLEISSLSGDIPFIGRLTFSILSGR